MLRIHFMQQWFNLSDPSMEEALHDVPVFRDFAGLSNWADAMPSESSKRPDANEGVTWHVAMRPGKRRALDTENNLADAFT